MSLFLHDFEDDVLVTFRWGGRPCWVASQVAARLGLGLEARRIPNRILGDWSEEFVPGHDYVVLTEGDLDAFNDELLVRGVGGGPLGGRRMILLFEPGLVWLVAKTNQPAGHRLRRFLAEQVLPRIATGPGVDRGTLRQHILMLFPDAKPRPSSPLPPNEVGAETPPGLHERFVTLQERRLGVAALHRLLDVVGDDLDPDDQKTLELMAAELGSGLPLSDMLFGDDDGPDEPEPAPTVAPTDAA